MAEDPVIPKLEDLKQAFIKSNKDEADRAQAYMNVWSSLNKLQS